MAYKTYTTEALVCGTFARNTADGSFLLFTREAGMLYANARSVREERSRQRYALQDFSLLRVSLVKGKTGWRVGSIEPQTNYYHSAPNKAARGSVVSVFRLLRRFLKGEEAAPELFDFVQAGLTVLAQEQDERAFVEMVIQVRILAALGYVALQEIPVAVRAAAPVNIPGEYSAEIVSKIEALYTQAVTVSHL